MTVKIELDAAQQAQLEATAKQYGMSVEDFAKHCVAQRLMTAPVGSASRAWELGKDLFGSFDSGRTDISQNVEQVLGEYFDSKLKARGTD